jgi:outer membrane protein OmpA-like peptidoglycan-associated protein
MAGMRLGLMVGLLALAGCKMPMAQHPASVTMPAIYLVFFHPASADITPVGKQIVDQAAAKVKESKPSTVTIAGYTADVGDPDEKLHMANQRIDAVRQALIADGVDPKLFLSIPLGPPDDSAGKTGDRRIEIRLQYGG